MVLTLMVIFFAQCSKEDSPFRKGSNYIVIDQPDQPSARLEEKRQALKFNSFKGMNDEQLDFTLLYQLASPVVDGATVQATHIVYQSNKLYLSYNTRGELIRGGMEIVDFSDQNNPHVSATGIRDAEFSSLDIFTNPASGRSYLTMVGAGWPTAGQDGAQVRLFELDASGFPILDPQIFDLNGFAGTDVNGLGIVTGTEGALYILDEQTLSFAQWEMDLEDARSIAFDENSGDYLALLGNPGRLITGLPSNPTEYLLGGISQVGSKAILRAKNGLAYVSLGEGGLKIVDISSGAVKAALDRPDIPQGENALNYVTNGVSVHSEGYLFIANGAAGVYVAKYNGSDEIDVLGSIDLNASVNYVEASGEYLFAATGASGVAIIKMSNVFGYDPLVTTNKPGYETITASSALGGGMVDQNGGSEILNKGVCWSTNTNPLKTDNSTSHGPGSGSFVSQLDQLSANTKYYVRAYAVTEHGIFYGQTENFTTKGNSEESDILTDARDGQEYRTLVVGDKIWMAENLAWMPSVSNVASGSLIDPFYYVYGYNGFDLEEAKSLDSYKTYGTLYNWNAAMTACPDGWHLPTDQDWMDLEESLGMDATDAQNDRFRNTGSVGDKLKSVSGWESEGNGSDVYGFTALPAGYRARGGEYKYEQSYASFWTSDSEEKLAIHRGIYYFNDGVYKAKWYKSAGFSVRCVREK